MWALNFQFKFSVVVFFIIFSQNHVKITLSDEMFRVLIRYKNHLTHIHKLKLRYDRFLSFFYSVISLVTALC